jgi:quercetin dioxygenase-like cupin family protein
MQYKRNEATRNRPSGDRVLDAPQLFIDLKEYIKQLKKEPAWEKNDRNGITVFKTDRLSMVLTGLHKKAVLDHIPVDGICTMQLLEGRAKVRVKGEEISMEPGQLMTFHSCVDHSVEAEKESFLLLTVDMAQHND